MTSYILTFICGGLFAMALYDLKSRPNKEAKR